MKAVKILHFKPLENVTFAGFALIKHTLFIFYTKRPENKGGNTEIWRYGS